MSKTILRIDSSAKTDDSVTRGLTGQLTEKISETGDTIVTRDLLEGIPLLNPQVTAQLTAPVKERTDDAAAVLALSDQLIAEVANADVIVIGAPMYNFGVPAVLKAWADLVGRAGTTFAYGETGPVGLLKNRPVYIVSASAGTPVGGEHDFGTTWLRHFLGFVGISNVTVIAAENLAADLEAGVTAGREAIATIG